MDSSLDAVVHLNVKLGERIVLVSGSLANISQRGSIDNVSNDESLDGLVLGNSLSGGHAADTLHVASTFLVSSVSPSLNSHDSKRIKRDGIVRIKFWGKKVNKSNQGGKKY
jgi:hypothetical protein